MSFVIDPTFLHTQLTKTLSNDCFEQLNKLQHEDVATEHQFHKTVERITEMVKQVSIKIGDGKITKEHVSSISYHPEQGGKLTKRVVNVTVEFSCIGWPKNLPLSCYDANSGVISVQLQLDQLNQFDAIRKAREYIIFTESDVLNYNNTMSAINNHFEMAIPQWVAEVRNEILKLFPDRL